MSIMIGITNLYSVRAVINAIVFSFDFMIDVIMHVCALHIALSVFFCQ